MSSYKRSYKLKQITPMIHFQWNEEGVCIRSSELKPKLDKFLVKKCDEKIESKWCLKQDSKIKSLNYKIKIYANGDVNRSEPPKYGMYFGNMGDAEKKQYIFYEDPLTLEVICSYEGLRELIDKYIYEFFAVTNFGTRQSKGFGCFQVEPCNEHLDYLERLKNEGYKFFYCDVGELEKEDKLKLAQIIYSVMKGGINRSGYKKENGKYSNPDAYIKGFIQRGYLDSLESGDNIGSDKALVKNKVITKGKGLVEHPKSSEIEYEKYFFVRALLGLADCYRFKDDIREGTAQIYHYFGTKINENGDFEIDKQNVEKDCGIHRFKSPVTISFIDDKIYFIFDDSYEKILGQTFEKILGQTFFLISNRYTDDKEFKEKPNKKIEILKKYARDIKVPDTFDIDKFINDFTEYFNSSDIQDKLNKLKNVDKNYGLAIGIELKCKK